MLWKTVRWLLKLPGGGLVARWARLAEHAARDFTGRDDFELTGEQALLNAMRGVGEDPVFLDVGANVGSWSKMCLELYPHARLHLFEPDPRLSARLHNSFTGNRVSIVDSALGAEDGFLEFYFSRDESTSAMNTLRSIESLGEFDEKWDKSTAKVMRGDLYAESQGLERVHLLKIDVEGYEYSVVKGFEKMFRGQKIDIVQFEYNFASAGARVNLEHFRNFFAEFGYEIGKLTYSGLSYDYDITWNNYDVAVNFIAITPLAKSKLVFKQRIF